MEGRLLILSTKQTRGSWFRSFSPPSKVCQFCRRLYKCRKSKSLVSTDPNKPMKIQKFLSLLSWKVRQITWAAREEVSRWAASVHIIHTHTLGEEFPALDWAQKWKRNIPKAFGIGKRKEAAEAQLLWIVKTKQTAGWQKGCSLTENISWNSFFQDPCWLFIYFSFYFSRIDLLKKKN